MFLVHVALPPDSPQHQPDDRILAINDVDDYYAEALRNHFNYLLVFIICCLRSYCLEENSPGRKTGMQICSGRLRMANLCKK